LYLRFTLRGIVPGDCKLFAWEDTEADTYQDVDSLHPYEERSEPYDLLRLVAVAHG
jgi:hypothetical protein